jgi:predicted RNA polymerase sigma factor
VDEGLVRALVPQVLAALMRRGADFPGAEDAVQEALVDALRTWPENPPRDPRAWLTTAAVHRLTDAVRSEAARRRRHRAGWQHEGKQFEQVEARHRPQPEAAQRGWRMDEQGRTVPPQARACFCRRNEQ